MTSISGGLMERRSLQITSKIAKRAQTINIVIWQADVLLQVSECARGVIVRFTRRQIGKHTHTDGEITNPYMRAGGAQQPGRDDEAQTKTLTHRWSVAESEWHMFTAFVVSFPSLMLRLLNGWKQEELPEAQRLNMCIFYFPKPFLLTGRSLFFFPMLFFSRCFLSFSFFSLSFPKWFSPSSLRQQSPVLLYSTGESDSLESYRRYGRGRDAPFCSAYIVFMRLLPLDLKSSFFFIASSSLCLPHQTHKEAMVKHATRSLGEKLLRAVNFPRSISSNLDELLFLFLLFPPLNRQTSEFIKSCRRRS